MRMKYPYSTQISATSEDTLALKAVPGLVRDPIYCTLRQLQIGQRRTERERSERERRFEELFVGRRVMHYFRISREDSFPFRRQRRDERTALDIPRGGTMSNSRFLPAATLGAVRSTGAKVCPVSVRSSPVSPAVHNFCMHGILRIFGHLDS